MHIFTVFILLQNITYSLPRMSNTLASLITFCDKVIQDCPSHRQPGYLEGVRCSVNVGATRLCCACAPAVPLKQPRMQGTKLLTCLEYQAEVRMRPYYWKRNCSKDQLKRWQCLMSVRQLRCEQEQMKRSRAGRR